MPHKVRKNELDIGENQQKILRTSLYLHIPFCESKCGYCAFNSQSDKNHLKLPYMERLTEYIAHKVKMLQNEDWQIQITSLYIGGGTPSVIDAHLYEKIFEILKPFIVNGAEMSVEANPNSLSLEWLQTMCALGVNRLSLGVQSFKKEKLEFLQRDHNLSNVFRAIEMASSVNLKNLSIDLIYGTPLCSKSLLKEELEIASKLPINHISTYHLSIEEGSRFFQKQQSLGLKEKEFDGFLSIGHFVAMHIGLPQYEVSNYGEISQHNLNYWQGNNYLGIGAGAVGYVFNVRTKMPERLDVFLRDFREEKECLSAEDLNLEHLFLGFRSCVGVLVDRIPNQKNLAILLEENKVYKSGDRVYACDYFLGDELALFLS